jgi:hypothetical protein
MGKNGSFSIECKDILYSGVCRLNPVSFIVGGNWSTRRKPPPVVRH